MAPQDQKNALRFQAIARLQLDNHDDLSVGHFVALQQDHPSAQLYWKINLRYDLTQTYAFNRAIEIHFQAKSKDSTATPLPNFKIYIVEGKASGLEEVDNPDHSVAKQRSPRLASDLSNAELDTVKNAVSTQDLMIVQMKCKIQDLVNNEAFSLNSPEGIFFQQTLRAPVNLDKFMTISLLLKKGNPAKQAYTFTDVWNTFKKHNKDYAGQPDAEAASFYLQLPFSTLSKNIRRISERSEQVVGSHIS